MARKVKLRLEDLHELRRMTERAKTEAGERLRVWIDGEIRRREVCGLAGGRTKRDAPDVDKTFDFGA